MLIKSSIFISVAFIFRGMSEIVNLFDINQDFGQAVFHKQQIENKNSYEYIRYNLTLKLNA